MKVLKFGADWCPGCLVMKPRFAEIEQENPWLETEFFDADRNPDDLKKWNVSDVLPCFVFIDKEDNEILRMDGEISKDKLIEVINENKDK